MYFHIDDEELLEKYEIIWTIIRALQNTELNALPIYDDRYRKSKIRAHLEKVYISFKYGLKVPEVM